MPHFTSNGTDQSMSKRLVKLPYSISRAASIDRTVVAYLRLAFSVTQNGQLVLQSVLINKPKFLKATRHAEIRKIEIPRSWWWRSLAGQAGAPVSIQPSKALYIIFETRPTSIALSPLFVGPRKKTDRGQVLAFPSETFRFAPLSFAHGGSALPWLTDDRPALRPRRIWCVLNR